MSRPFVCTAIAAEAGVIPMLPSAGQPRHSLWLANEAGIRGCDPPKRKRAILAIARYGDAPLRHGTTAFRSRNWHTYRHSAWRALRGFQKEALTAAGTSIATKRSAENR
jgi:hypothetical protein